MPNSKSTLVGWAQVLATIFLGVVGLIFTLLQTEQQEKNRVAITNAQLISQREQSEMEFRQQMFGVLVAELLNSDLNVEDRVTRLELFQHNFHDIFNARALFDVLEKEAEKLPIEQRERTIEDLVSIAEEVTESQELLVGASSTRIKISEGDSIMIKDISPPPIDSQNSFDGDHHHGENDLHAIHIKLIRVKKHAVDVRVWFPNNEIDWGEDGRDFEVSFFDAPFTDNILLPDRHRFAVTLKKTNINEHPHEAELNVFEFPAHYVTTGYRPSIREVTELFSEINHK